MLIENATIVLPERIIVRGYLYFAAPNTDPIIGEGAAPLLEIMPAQRIDGTHKVLLPGLTNAHTHLEQTFMRGYSANRSLLEWLKGVIWKLQAAMSAEDVRLAATLGIVEAVRGGATHIVDHHKVPFSAQHTDVVLDAADKLGVRLTLARAWADRGANAESGPAIVQDLQRLFGEWHGAANGRIRIANGPLVPWRCTPALLQQTTALARQHGAVTHCHMNETQEEVAMTLGETGKRPLEWFDTIGVLGSDFQAVHGVWLSDQEINALRQNSVTVVHCPAANMILASGAAPIARLLREGVPVRLASDGPASNDGQDMFEMMRLCALLGKVSTLDAQMMQPHQVIGMAIGHTQPRDWVMLNMNAAHIQPIGDIQASLLYNCRGSDVDTVIVDGRLLMQNKHFIGLDEGALLEECRARVHALRLRAGI